MVKDMNVIYWRDICKKCQQSMVYGWTTNDNIFYCCACHDQNDYSDTRVTVIDSEIEEIVENIPNIDILIIRISSPLSIMVK